MAEVVILDMRHGNGRQSRFGNTEIGVFAVQLSSVLIWGMRLLRDAQGQSFISGPSAPGGFGRVKFGTKITSPDVKRRVLDLAVAEFERLPADGGDETKQCHKATYGSAQL